MKCIIVEDQTPAQRVLKKYIADYMNINLVGVFSDPIEALNFLKTESIDLIFLDIHLPKLSGIDFLKALSHPPAVIFTTAFSDYAVKSYELDVVDYLVKPFSFERFVKAVSKVTPQTISTSEKNKIEDDFFVKIGYEYVKINKNEILYIQSDMDYTEIHFKEKKLLSTETLTHWEKTLDPNQFSRVHKSYLINLNQISKISGNQIYLNADNTVPIGRAYKESFVSKYVKN